MRFLVPRLGATADIDLLLGRSGNQPRYPEGQAAPEVDLAGRRRRGIRLQQPELESAAAEVVAPTVAHPHPGRRSVFAAGLRGRSGPSAATRARRNAPGRGAPRTRSGGLQHVPTEHRLSWLSPLPPAQTVALSAPDSMGVSPKPRDMSSGRKGACFT